MQAFMQNVATGCIAFTFSCLFYLMCSILKIFPPFNDQMVIHMFILSIVIMLFINLIHLLPIENILLVRFLELLSIMIVLISASFSIKLFPFTLHYLIPVLSIGVLTYHLVIIVIFIGNQASAKKINQIIQQQNEVFFHDKSN